MLESSVFSVTVFHHVAKNLDGKSRFFNFKILAEMAKLQLHVVVTAVPNLIERVKYIVPVDRAGERRFVLVGEGVVVV